MSEKSLKKWANSWHFRLGNILNDKFFLKELEEIEEKWQKESLKLIEMVNKLKDDNKRLNDSLAHNNSFLKQNDQLSNLIYWFG